MTDFLTDDVPSLFVIEKLSQRTIVAYISLTADTVALNLAKLAVSSYAPDVLEFYSKNGFSPLKNLV